MRHGSRGRGLEAPGQHLSRRPIAELDQGQEPGFAGDEAGQGCVSGWTVAAKRFLNIAMAGLPYPYPEWMSRERRAIEAIDRKSGFRLQDLTPAERRLVMLLRRHCMVEGTRGTYVTTSICQHFLGSERDRAFGRSD